MVNASNKTAFNLFNQVLSSSENNNTLISPLSIYIALAMIYNGANGKTADSIAKVLEMEGISIDDLNATSKALIEQLPAEDNTVTLSVANSIWYRNEGMQPLASFLDIAKENYKAEINPIDFSNPSAVITINNWVSVKTNGKIPGILENVDASDLMYLINAIYFHGLWQHPFKTSDTHTDIFHAANKEVSTSFMSQEVSIPNISNDKFDMVELPYGTGKAFSMYILLPVNANETINQFYTTLDESTIENAIALMQVSTKTLIIPKWEYSFALEDLKKTLTALGMGMAFSDTADFSNLYTGKVEITKAIHKTFIKVDEEGTEAAAATAIGIGVGAALPSPPFKADHPFLYIIAEKQTGIILFMGTVNDPSEN